MQEVFTSTRRKLPYQVKLFGIVRQCLRSPANCDRHHIHSNLRASLNSAKWSFRIHLSIPWCQKLQNKCISFHRCKSHWFELEGYLRNKRSQQNSIPKISKKRTENNFISGKSLAQRPSLWKILQFFQGILVTESTSATSPKEKMPSIGFVEAMAHRMLGWQMLASWQDVFDSIHVGSGGLGLGGLYKSL